MAALASDFLGARWGGAPWWGAASDGVASIVLWATLQLLLNALAGWTTTGPRWRRAAGLSLATVAASLAWWAPAQPLLRALMTLGGTLCWMRCLELYRDQALHTAGWRVFSVLSESDPRTHVATKPVWNAALWWQALGYAGLSWLGFAMVDHASGLPAGSAHWLLRWAGGAVAVYATFDAVVAVLRALKAAFGQDVPSYHRCPVAARTLREFWGERWNLVVHRWLYQHCFLPVALRRHPESTEVPGRPSETVAVPSTGERPKLRSHPVDVALGVIAAFLASAALHFWLMWAAAGALWAGMMAAFFVVQMPIFGIERWWTMERRPAWLGHLWTKATLLLCSPLFVEPALRVVMPRAN